MRLLRKLLRISDRRSDSISWRNDRLLPGHWRSWHVLTLCATNIADHLSRWICSWRASHLIRCTWAGHALRSGRRRHIRLAREILLTGRRHIRLAGEILLTGRRRWSWQIGLTHVRIHRWTLLTGGWISHRRASRTSGSSRVRRTSSILRSSVIGMPGERSGIAWWLLWRWKTLLI